MPRVLIVDDASDVRLMERAVLSRSGFDVEEAAGGPEALARLAGADLPDVVVLDVQMPEMDGWETLATIRSDPRSARLPVILCTVKAGPEDVERAWRTGCDGYLVKPFPITVLIEEVSEVVARSDEQRSLVRRLRWNEAVSRMESTGGRAG